MNVELLKEVRDFIIRHPRNIEMWSWGTETVSCGTVGCIAHITCVLTGREVKLHQTAYEAGQALGLTSGELPRLFLPDRWPGRFRARLLRAAGQEYANVVAARINYFIKTGK